ncbi:MAG: DUF2796 domain-containing protein [Pseudomonadota bacterium]
MTNGKFGTKRASIACTIVLATAAASTAVAEDAHEHGASNLSIAIDGEQMRIEFKSPLANLIGFEHEPQTAAQRGAASSLRDMLQAPGHIVRLPASANCVLNAESRIQVEGPDYIVSAQHDDDHEGHDHDDKHHDDDHHGDEQHADAHHGDDHHGDDHHGDAHHGDDHHGDEQHNDIAVTYDFVCTQSAAMTSIDVPAFRTFPGIEHIDVQAVGERGVVSVELTREATALDLSSL